MVAELKICLLTFFVIKSCDSIGTVDDMNLFSFNNGLVASTVTSGITFGGSNSLLRITAGTYNGQAGSVFNLGTATFDTVYIQNVQIKNDTGITGIAIAANGANINSGGFGLISGCYFETPANAVTGYSELDEEWSVRDNGDGLISSDRFEPSGWAIYNDSETSPATQAITTTFQKVQIDGSGANSNSSYLPKAIRGTGELWDTTNDKITPIIEGDSYNVRIDLEITAKGGGIGALFLQLDIGGGATPTIPIVDRVLNVSKSVPFTVSVGFPIFSLSTFISNGGQLFLATDSGTATLASRAIFIQRNTSGAS